jgi:hypothetical protein
MNSDSLLLFSNGLFSKESRHDKEYVESVEQRKNENKSALLLTSPYGLGLSA